MDGMWFPWNTVATPLLVRWNSSDHWVTHSWARWWLEFGQSSYTKTPSFAKCQAQCHPWALPLLCPYFSFLAATFPELCALPFISLGPDFRMPLESPSLAWLPSWGLLTQPVLSLRQPCWPGCLSAGFISTQLWVCDNLNPSSKHGAQHPPNAQQVLLEFTNRMVSRDRIWQNSKQKIIMWTMPEMEGIFAPGRFNLAQWANLFNLLWILQTPTFSDIHFCCVHTAWLREEDHINYKVKIVHPI